jgi:PAS domain S-box-containing protein
VALDCDGLHNPGGVSEDRTPGYVERDLRRDSCGVDRYRQPVMPGAAAALEDTFAIDAVKAAPAAAPVAARLERFSHAGAWMLIALGTAVLAGWELGIEVLKRVHPDYAAMKPNTALLFVLLGAVMARPARATDLVGRLLALVIVAVGGLTLLEYATGIDLALDTLLLIGTHALPADPASARMSHVTAGCFTLLGAAALLLDSRRFLLAARVAAYAVLAVSFLALCGLVYGAQQMYGIGPPRAALHTIVGGVVASLTVLAARSDGGIVAIFASATGAGKLLRWLTPVLVVFPMAFAQLGLMAETSGIYDTRLGDALLVTATVVILFIATAAIARTLYRYELARTAAQDELLDRERALAESEYKYRDLYEHAPDMHASARTADGIVVDCNQTLLDALGRAREEVIGFSLFDLYDPSCLDKVRVTFAEFRRTGSVNDVMLSLRRADGSRLEVSLSASAIRDERGEVIRSRAVWHDVSGHRQLAELRERDRFFQLSVDMVGILSARGYFLQLSPAFCSVLGWTSQELRATPFIDFVHEGDRAATLDVARRVNDGKRTLSFSNRFRCKDGTYRWLQWRAQPDESGLVYSIARDITDDMQAAQELKRSEETLRASLRERELLLQEIHHRVKNNLQVVSSLIGMQLRQPAARDASAALRECQGRIQTIALIHEKLYQSDDLARVPFSDYASGLVANIFEASGGCSRPIALEVETDPIRLAVDQAIPCGLILNELVSNALKHAFDGRESGRIRVELREDGPDVLLSVSDDGVGVAADFDAQRAGTLGLDLVAALVEQLRGKLTIEHASGATFRVRFSREGNT